MVGQSLDPILAYVSVRKESMGQKGIQFIRKKKSDGRTIYFIANTTKESFEGWLPFHVKAGSVVLYDPMNGEFGKGKFRKANDDLLEVYVHLTQEQSLIIETYQDEIETPPFNYYEITDVSIPLSGKWKISFTSGGPELPAPLTRDTLSSWTTFGPLLYPAFSGTASYTLEFSRPNQVAKSWLLDLGDVKESAHVYLNGKSLGKLIGPVYQLHLNHSLLLEKNVLEIRVSNLMANRIADLDKRGVFWKKFYNVNFPARKVENRKNGLFNASHWVPKESGLFGPVTLTRLVAN